MDNINLQLKNEFPGRSDQIDVLTNLILKPGSSTIPFIYVNGHTATGKTSLLTRLADLYVKSDFNDGNEVEFAGNSNIVVIDSTECIYPKILFRRAITTWFKQEIYNDPNLLKKWKCETFEDFAKVLNENNDFSTKYMILDNAEKLRDLGHSFISSLLYIAEQASEKPSFGSFPEPIILQFNQYKKSEVIKILELDCPENEPLAFFATFADSMYETFHRSCNDINELRQLISLLYPKYIQPIFEKQATRNETARLFKLCQPYFVAATDKLYLREISSFEWQNESIVASAKNDFATVEKSIANMTTTTGLQELPYLTKYLLISAFIASYNPPKLDFQYFAKASESKSKRRQRVPKRDDTGSRVNSTTTDWAETISSKQNAGNIL
ncbi:hypothetical protein BB559_001226 [Furculomyces boomerangus]|uniref:Orc1-like AAA ATPase domain-containing protein n=1 Tax=Furculomyces boomerangus TaxID=61424 RepID=A0A2T9Z2L5_9FUNG|nr:hypothetical protein BB559_001226 [Furculomyces boomerangus]